MGSTLNPSYTAVVQRPLDTFVSFRRTLERNKGLPHGCSKWGSSLYRSKRTACVNGE